MIRIFCDVQVILGVHKALVDDALVKDFPLAAIGISALRFLGVFGFCGEVVKRGVLWRKWLFFSVMFALVMLDFFLGKTGWFCAKVLRDIFAEWRVIEVTDYDDVCARIFYAD